MLVSLGHPGPTQKTFLLPSSFSILKNIPLDNNSYSWFLNVFNFTKIDYSKVPAFVRMIMPKGTMEFHEESWNAYPYSKTVITVGKIY